LPVVLLHGGTVSFEHNYAVYGWIKQLNDSGLQVVGLGFRGPAMLALAKASYPPLPVEEASSIDVPELVVSGEKDLVLGRGPRLADALGTGEYLEVAGADHFSLAADLGTREAVARYLTAATGGLTQ